jgi:hypothetical protein
MAKSTNTPLPKRWQDEPWASREAKRKDKPYKRQEPWKQELKEQRLDYQDDPVKYRAEIERQEPAERERIEEALKNGNSYLVEDINDKCLKSMQHIIDRMATQSKLFGKPTKPPKLLVYKTTSEEESAALKQVDIGVKIRDYIECNEFTKNYFLEHPDQFKAMCAHEMAHLVNGDCDVENTIRNLLTPPNHLQEVLADRMGAIIHGKPRVYANSMTDFLMADAKENHFLPSRSFNEHPSGNARARALHKWADILEREDAIDAKGNVILDKAMAVYERSKELTEDLLAIDLAMKYPQFSR